MLTESSLQFKGIGLHTGHPCAVAVQLATDLREAITFRTSRGDVAAIPASVASTELSMVLGREGARIATVEHLLSALTAMGHWSALVFCQGNEIPILDGSALPFLDGIPENRFPPEPFRLSRSLEIRLGAASVQAVPSDCLEIDYRIEFPGTAIGIQQFFYRHSPAAYRKEIAPARTFTLLREVEEARSRGLIKGGSLDCALVFGEDGPINPPLRFPDEPVRHKILDLLGDLALLGRPFMGRLTVVQGGHALHAKLVRAIWKHP